MLHSIRRTTTVLAAALLPLVALSACGDGGDGRTRNAALDTRTCAEGGPCTVGDTGPGGGVVFFDAGSDLEWGRYLEVAPENWAANLSNVTPGWKEKPATGDNARTEDPYGQFNPYGERSVPNFSPTNNGNGTGKKEWLKVKDYRCGTCITDTIAEYNQQGVADWYLPNANEMETLIRANVRRLSNLVYWTSTNLPANTPQMIQWVRSNQRATDWRYQGFYNFSFYTFLPIRAFSSVPLATTTDPTTTTEVTVPESTSPTTGPPVDETPDSSAPDTSAPTEPVESSDLERSLGDITDPNIALPAQDVEDAIDPDAVVEDVQAQLPELTVVKIEIAVESPDNTEPQFAEITGDAPANLSIPADATRLTLRITGAGGEVVEQVKSIVRPGGPDEGATSTTTPAPTDDDTTGGSSGMNPVVWVLLGISLVAVAAVGVRLRRR